MNTQQLRHCIQRLYERWITKLSYCLLLCLVLSQSTAAQAQLKVQTDFPGGSGEVVSLNEKNQHLVLNPTNHPGHGWRCWWYVRLTGIRPGETVTLDVGNAPWATPDQATFSVDGGETWQHTEKGERDQKRIVYKLKVDADFVLVAWGPPFVSSDAKALVEKLAAGSEAASAFTLCQTRGGRETPAIRIGAEEGRDKPLVWIQARQHAWESGSSWVAQGFGEWLVSDDAGAVWLRRNTEVVLVPVMDIDNVDLGAGGKSQTPHDHNRDWGDDPHWNSVAAAHALIRKAAENDKLAAFVDLHNPAAEDLSPFFYLSSEEIMSDAAKVNQTRFLAIAKEEMRGPLRFNGRVKSSGSAYDKNWTKISGNWASLLGTPAIAVTLETSWNTPHSTTENYRTIGRQLGQSISRSLKEQAESGKNEKD
ncbi:MAG: zinc carboxypeptidase [Pirellulaceae bacterium]|nr:zinc carboxypeptidase [Pirellulaceae bacterium]